VVRNPWQSDIFGELSPYLSGNCLRGEVPKTDFNTNGKLRVKEARKGKTTHVSFQFLKEEFLN
jgi:hypothetical protein